MLISRFYYSPSRPPAAAFSYGGAAMRQLFINSLFRKNQLSISRFLLNHTWCSRHSKNNITCYHYIPHPLLLSTKSEVMLDGVGYSFCSFFIFFSIKTFAIMPVSLIDSPSIFSSTQVGFVPQFPV
jgi:hypothetical protein